MDLKQISRAEAIKLNNEYMPMFNNIKIVTPKEIDKSVIAAQRAGIQLQEDTKKKLTSRNAYGIIVARGCDADPAMLEGMIVEFGKYAGYRPLVGTPPQDSDMEYQVIQDIDVTQILMDNDTYKKMFVDTKEEK